MVEIEDDEFHALVEEAMNEPVEGWDFPFLDARTRTEPMSWDYSSIGRNLMADADHALDHGTGGGEVIAAIGMPKKRLVASEAYLPNVAVAAERLGPLGAHVVHVDHGTFNIYGPDAEHPERRLPFDDDTFDLVLARHVAFSASEVFRVLRPGGRFLHQAGRVGPARPGEVTFISHFPGSTGPEWPGWSVPDHLTSAGFILDEYREQLRRTHFLDIGAVIYRIRTAPWAVDGFDLDTYLPHLHKLHQHINAHGSLITAGTALFALATKPGPNY